MDLGFGGVGEQGGRATCIRDGMVDIAAGIGEGKAGELDPMADSLIDRRETRVAQGFLEFWLAAQDEGDLGERIGIEVDEVLDGQEGWFLHVLRVVDDDDGLSGVLGHGLEVEGAGLGGIEGRFDEECQEDGFDEVGRGESETSDIDGRESVGIECGDEGAKRDGLAGADGP